MAVASLVATVKWEVMLWQAHEIAIVKQAQLQREITTEQAYLHKIKQIAEKAVAYSAQVKQKHILDFSENLPVWEGDPLRVGLLVYTRGKPECGQIHYGSLLSTPGKPLSVRIWVGQSCPGHPRLTTALKQFHPILIGDDPV
jgi:hypothetical protein